MQTGQGRHPTVAFLLLADALVAACSLYLAFLLRSRVFPLLSSVWTGDIRIHPDFEILAIGTLPIMLGSLHLSGAYNWLRVRGIGRIALSAARAFLIASVGVFAFAYALRDRTFSRAIVVAYLLLATGGFVLVRLFVRDVFNLLRARGIGLSNALIVGTGPAARMIAKTMQGRPHLGFAFRGFVSVPGERDAEHALETVCDINDLPQYVDRSVVDAVVFAISLDESAKYEQVIYKLEETGKTVHLRGDAVGVLLSRTFIGEFEGMPILTLSSTPRDRLALAIKRAIDVLGSAFFLFLLSPIFAITALFVKLTDRGPVFYYQERVGLNGRRIRMIKFRSMYIDADKRLAELMDKNEMTGPVFKMKNDPRITPIGRWIRKFSVDELPQLWNVLVGDMSLVGPRPPIPAEVVRYERWQRRRLSMKPGITCLWQVGGRNELDFATWMKLDMEYIDNWSLALDIKILLKTIPVVITAKGAR